MRRTLAGLLPLLLGVDLLQSPNAAVEEGNAQMRAGKPEQALAAYDRAAKELPAEPAVRFDRGAALFALGRFPEAVEEFLRATEARAPSLKAAAFYNLGNAFFRLEKYGDAVAAYRRALTIDPGDLRAKWNLELALKKKKEQDDKQKQDQKNDQKQDKQKQDQKNDQKQDKQKQDQKNDQKQGGDDQKQDQQKPEPKQDGQPKQKEEKPAEQQQQQGQQAPPPQPQDKGPTREEIEAILDGLERAPKELAKERAKLRAVRRARPAKDW